MQRLRISARALSFWTKLKYDETPRLSKLIFKFIRSKNNMAIPSTLSRPNPGNYTFPWLDFIEKSLNEAGLSETFDSVAMHNPKDLICQIKQQVRDARVRKWR